LNERLKMNCSTFTIRELKTMFSAGAENIIQQSRLMKILPSTAGLKFKGVRVVCGPLFLGRCRLYFEFVLALTNASLEKTPGRLVADPSFSSNFMVPPQILKGFCLKTRFCGGG
jgi:hypothetical protein